MAKSSLRPLSADLAINLYEALLAARRLQLQPALGQAVSAIGVAIIDAQLQRLVPAEALDRLGGLGMRGERVFPVPAILRHAPPLIGYYRMLLGLSKKEFGDRLGYGPWRDAETLHVLPVRLVPHLDDFCTALIAPLAELVAAMGSFDDRDLSDLTLLTLGPTLQGGRNNVIGALVARRVFEVLRALVAPGLALDDRRRIRFTTPHGRTFELLEGADPDIRLVAVSGEQTTPVVAIEIKGGSDASNALNRAGEAEKSHIKARHTGYIERWTIMVLGNVSRQQVRSAMPSATALFEARAVMEQAGADWDSLRQRLGDLIGEPLLP